ncbi:MAG TPA: tyrosine-type recombinase/integrase [Tepidisphaeraceae bacterium]|nr:tyrosine-type recombinase/integrase [Tepidisphaeraceae bacterium]
MSHSLPNLPFAGFPLRPHQNGYWYKSLWNPRSKKSEQFYFGKWSEDPKGERAISDPVSGWLARRPAILAGVDNVRVQPSGDDLSLGELMTRFLTFKRKMVQAGELSLTTLGDYLREVQHFVTFFKPSTPAGGLRPEHFTAYMNHLIDGRNLGRHARKRVRGLITAFLRFGEKNGWYQMPNCGTEWVAPATGPEAMRQAKARAGIKDVSDRILTGEEIDRLLERACPTFKGIILIAANTGLGPADIGRLTWDKIDMHRGRLRYPRGKTGVARFGYLWKKTRKALQRLQTLKHNRIAIAREGSAALVFLTRTGRPFYREEEKYIAMNVSNALIHKMTGVVVNNAISITFGRMAREVGLEGVGLYRLRHTFKTLGKKARDAEALDACMGHSERAVCRVYDHEEISWRRIRRVAKAVYRKLWPRVKQSGNRPQDRKSALSDCDSSGEAVAA